MKRVLVVGCLLVLLAPSLALSEIYRWVDDKGNVHFGDQPPEPDAAKKIQVSNDKLGVKLSTPKAVEAWKKGSVADEDDAPFSSRENEISYKSKYSPADGLLCESDRDDCFSSEEDQVCILRWGLHCEDVYLWSVCERQNCLRDKNRDTCASPFYYLDNRPNSMNSRDLGRTFPSRSAVSDGDWQCLLRTGLYCDEYSDAAKCESDYGQSCEALENWVETSFEQCRKNKSANDCEKLVELIKRRPVTFKEQKRNGFSSFRRHVSHDVLMGEHGFKRSDASKEDQMWKVLHRLPMASPQADLKGRLQCERLVDQSLERMNN